MEEPSKPSPDMLATAESSSSEPDKEVESPDAVATATFSSVEEPGPKPTPIPPVWDRGGPPQQVAAPAPDNCQPGSTSTAVGTNEDLRLPRRRPPPGKQIPCSSPGCCLSFPSIRDLAQHLRTHCPPTQSLEGKLFRCSALSCTESFPSMQELVAHGKLHYKPNRYFKCENCLLRFRTHRSLFKHLHVCAEHAQSPVPPPPPALDKEPPVPERPADSDPSSTLSLPFPLLEPFTSAPTGPFLPYLNPAPFGLSPPRLRPFLAAAPGPPASSTAIWRKSQGECENQLPAKLIGPTFIYLPLSCRCCRKSQKTSGRLRCALRCVQVTTRAGWRGLHSCALRRPCECPEAAVRVL
ncbi:zinc finger protein 414 isoform X3 [Microtus ochrogaster]|uniref:Zinc finger protein 414 isoform X3 n=1 Tax=Microtus ochrogaster TaxID=79684 RepID=A0ABM0LS90_MICOH|nr:zinc finger protein 414 isoform X3 [Microtus ochrogaster]